jgi:hypothetical protein
MNTLGKRPATARLVPNSFGIRRRIPVSADFRRFTRKLTSMKGRAHAGGL